MSSHILNHCTAVNPPSLNSPQGRIAYDLLLIQITSNSDRRRESPKRHTGSEIQVDGDDNDDEEPEDMILGGNNGTFRECQRDCINYGAGTGAIAA